MIKFIKPHVVKIAETKINTQAVRDMLQSQEWTSPYMEKTLADCEQGKTSDAATLIETSGRICYRSFAPHLNPNVALIRTSTESYLANILEKGDGSILEHASVTFAFLCVSRVFTHELARHRVGTAISQESLRYVRLQDLAFWLPDDVPERVRVQIVHSFQHSQQMYESLQDAYDWNRMSMREKKAATSAIRRMLPDGIATHVIWTANHRTIRHVLEMRTSTAAEIEMRYVFDRVGEIVTRDYPEIYQDFCRHMDEQNIPYWQPKIRSKV